MKHIIAAALALLLATLPTGPQAHAQRPNPEQPQDVYSVEFTADWQGIGAIGAVPADLTITAGAMVYTRTLNNLLAGPVFTVEVPFPGPYAWRLKGWQHLATGGVGATSPISAGVQLVGDAPLVVAYSTPPCPWDVCWRYETGDDVVETLDFSRLRAMFGQPRPCCPPAIMEFDAVDLTGNGVVNVDDFSLLASNFGKSGYTL